jgi:hypothetical protein
MKTNNKLSRVPDPSEEPIGKFYPTPPESEIPN